MAKHKRKDDSISIDCLADVMPRRKPVKVEPKPVKVDRPSHTEMYTDPDTGASKGMKLERFDLIPPEALKALAGQYGMGASRYGDRNWENGYPWSLAFAALNRHLWAFWSGEDIDPESGRPHMDAVMWHAFALRTFMENHKDKDDRSVYDFNGDND